MCLATATLLDAALLVSTSCGRERRGGNDSGRGGEATPSAGAAGAVPDSRPAASAGGASATGGAGAAACEMPATPPAGLVIALERGTVPRGRSARVERIQITGDGACDPATACVRVAAAPLAVPFGLLSGLARRPAFGERASAAGRGSPHYGWRSIDVRWAGAACRFTDGPRDPLAPDDLAAFHSAFDALEALAAERGGR
jgi:hypothetical protein